LVEWDDPLAAEVGLAFFLVSLAEGTILNFCFM